MLRLKHTYCTDTYVHVYTDAQTGCPGKHRVKITRETSICSLLGQHHVYEEKIQIHVCFFLMKFQVNGLSSLGSKFLLFQCQLGTVLSGFGIPLVVAEVGSLSGVNIIH